MALRGAAACERFGLLGDLATFSITKFTDPVQNRVLPFRIRCVPIQEAAIIIDILQEGLNGGHGPRNAVATFRVHPATPTTPRRDNETEPLLLV